MTLVRPRLNSAVFMLTRQGVILGLVAKPHSTGKRTARFHRRLELRLTKAAIQPITLTSLSGSERRTAKHRVVEPQRRIQICLVVGDKPLVRRARSAANVSIDLQAKPN